LEAFRTFTVLDAPDRTTVEVPFVKVEKPPDVFQFPDTFIVPLVREIVFAEASFIVTSVKVIVEDVAVSVPPLWTTRLAPPVTLLPPDVSVPDTVRVTPTSIALDWVTDPVIVKVANPFDALSVLTVFAAPDIVTVLVPFVNVEPAPDVSKLPETVHKPLVKVMTPDDPPVIVTSETLTADAFAVRTPKSPTIRAPPVKLRFDVAKAVVEPLPETVSVPAHRRPRVPIVKVTVPLPATLWNVTLLNSFPVKLLPANVTAALLESLNVTVPDPAAHPPAVEAFVQVPETVHDSEPNAM